MYVNMSQRQMINKITDSGTRAIDRITREKNQYIIMGEIGRRILDHVNYNIRSSLRINQWKDTNKVLQ